MAIAPFESISWCCDQHLAGWWAEDSAPTRWLSWLDVSGWCWCQGCNKLTINFMVGFWTRRLPTTFLYSLPTDTWFKKKNMLKSNRQILPQWREDFPHAFLKSLSKGPHTFDRPGITVESVGRNWWLLWLDQPGHTPNARGRPASQGKALHKYNPSLSWSSSRGEGLSWSSRI